ncbi:MAG: pyridoxine 5'-phosphate synthase [Planctomycetes bacterium]|nr:pyridoxine 5'-phosphate synthase [Planctomycetota bacterium]
MVGLSIDLGFLRAILSLEGGDVLDAAALAHRADQAGADLLVVPLGGEDGPGYTVEEALRVRSILRKPLCVALRGLRLLDGALKVKPEEVLFLSEGGGPVKLELATAAAGPLSEAAARVRAAGIVPVIAVEASESAVLAAQDAGAAAVELSAGEFAASRTEDQAVEAHRRLARAARSASDLGLRVRTGGGSPSPARVSRLAEVPEVEQVRVGAALLAGAVYEGIGAAVAALRGEVERGARRGDSRAAGGWKGQGTGKEEE